MGPEDRMGGFGEGRRALAVALLHGPVIVMVEGALALQGGAHLVGQGLVGGIAIGEDRVAAEGGHLHRIEAGALVGDRRMHHVVMEHHLAVRQGPDGLAVFADVRDQHDIVEETVEARRTKGLRPRQLPDLAEDGGDIQQVLL